MNCDMIICPHLTCPPEQQLSIPNECCKFCKGDSKFLYREVTNENQNIEEDDGDGQINAVKPLILR